jgi:uncharacterized protein (TIGR02145 family)
MVDNLAITGVSGKPLILDSTDSDLAPDTSYSLGVQINPNVGNPQGKYCENLNTDVYPQKCGYQYLWGTVVVGNNPNSVVDVAYSICPKNWRLPTLTDHKLLASTYGWTGKGGPVISSAWRGLYAGVWDATSTLGDYALHFSSTSANPASNGTRQIYSLRYSGTFVTNAERIINRTGYGSVRCLAR